MAGVSWDLEARVKAPPEAAYAWLTDYTEDDHSRPAFLRAAGAKPGTKATRKFLARGPDSLQLEDTWGGRKFQSTVRFDRQAKTITIEGEFGYRAVWRVTPDGTGSKVQVEGRMQPSGAFKLLMPLFAGKMKAETTKDFHGHIADLEAELGVAPQAGR